MRLFLWYRKLIELVILCLELHTSLKVISLSTMKSPYFILIGQKRLQITHACRSARCISGTKAAEVVFHSVMAVQLWQGFDALIDSIMWTFSRWLSWCITCRQTLRYRSQSTTGLLIWFSQNDPLQGRPGASRPTICAPRLVLTSLIISRYSHRQTTQVNLMMHICLGQGWKYSSTMPDFWCVKFDCSEK